MMRRGKFRFLLVSLLVALGLLLAGGEARANFANFKYSISPSVTIDTVNTGTYTYDFASTGGSSTAIKNVLFEIPAELYDVLISTNFTVSYQAGTNPTFIPISFTVFPVGAGDPDTRLGLNDFRFSVLSVNPPSTSFPKNGFTLKLSLSGITIPGDKRLSGTISGVVQLKSGNNLSDSDTSIVPALENIPPPSPTAPSVTITPNPTTIGYGLERCSVLSWTSNGDIVAISEVGLVKAPGVSSVTPEVCPAKDTTYKITAIGTGGVSDCTALVTVIQPPPPVIEASQETVEKKDETTGEVAGYVTFYSMNGVLECACSTGPDQLADPIIPYEQACLANNPKCTSAFESDAGDLFSNPLLVCVWVIGDPSTQCNPVNDSEYCYSFVLEGKTYKCDKWALQTRDTIVEIGKKSCTCGFATKLNRYGKPVSVWSCTGTTCAACNYTSCP